MENIIGKKFGRLTIIDDMGVLIKGKAKCHYVKCKCECGNIKVVRLPDIKSHKTCSCGCFQKELNSMRMKNIQKSRHGNPKHNLCYTKLYRIYHQKKSECYNKNNVKYPFFGGRNILFCDEWLDSKNGFKIFYNWAITNGYSEEKKSLCRKDLDKGFSPDNCFFETTSYARKHCQSDKSIKSRYTKADNWRKNNKNLLFEAIHKGLKTKMEKYGKLVNNRAGCSWKQGWRDIGGHHKYFRSKWEANYARYLEFLKQNGKIKDWQHEVKTFWFDKIKRGCCSYLPDFEVTNNDGSIEYHEVKGWYDDRSKTKIKRMAKYYPNIKLVVIFGKDYRIIANQVKNLIEDWE